MSEGAEKVFHVSSLENETVKQSLISCNTSCNSGETTSLKGLAHKVLLRNSQCNTHETKPFQGETRDETARKTPFDHEAFAERAAIIQGNGVPREWAEGYATLCTMPRPSAYAPQRWKQLVDDGGFFLDQWGRDAAKRGWRAVDVFGVNPDAPESRYDGAGLVPLLCGRRVCAVKDNAAGIDCGGGRFLTFYRQNLSPASVALWKLGG